MSQHMPSLSLALIFLALLMFGLFLAGSSAPASAVTLHPEHDVTRQVSMVLTDTISHTMYLPLIRRDPWIQPPLLNTSFEGDWWRKTHTGQEFGEIFVPEYWIAFWKEDAANWVGRPEMKVINFEAPFIDPPRVYSGTRGLMYFGFFRNVDAGIYQQVGTLSGLRYRVSAYAHAWYSQGDDARVSQWIDEYGVLHQINDGDPGMELMIGIDPTGNTDPWASSIVWQSAHIYDQFEILEVYAEAQSGMMTVFLRAKSLYPFKHADIYWDGVTFEVLE